MCDKNGQFDVLRWIFPDFLKIHDKSFVFIDLGIVMVGQFLKIRKQIK